MAVASRRRWFAGTAAGLAIAIGVVIAVADGGQPRLSSSFGPAADQPFSLSYPGDWARTGIGGGWVALAATHRPSPGDGPELRLSPVDPGDVFAATAFGPAAAVGPPSPTRVGGLPSERWEVERHPPDGVVSTAIVVRVDLGGGRASWFVFGGTATGFDPGLFDAILATVRFGPPVPAPSPSPTRTATASTASAGSA